MHETLDSADPRDPQPPQGARLPCDLELPEGVEIPEAAETLDQLVARLADAHPELAPGRIHAIVVEEHGLLVGLEPGDIVPPLVVAATVERVLRDAEKALGAGGGELARDDAM